jgi:predicted DNA-binding transcriptional regulator YafY
VRSYTLDPYGLVNKAGVWYLVADHDGEPRLFRTDRTQSATVLDEPVRRRDGVELADVGDVLRRAIDDLPADLPVTARVRDRIVAVFGRVHAPDLVSGPEPDQQGWQRFELRFRSVFAAQALLAFGPEVEVLSPDSVREDLAEKARATVALYAGASTSFGS